MSELKDPKESKNFISINEGNVLKDLNPLLERLFSKEYNNMYIVYNKETYGCISAILWRNRDYLEMNASSGGLNCKIRNLYIPNLGPFPSHTTYGDDRDINIGAKRISRYEERYYKLMEYVIFLNTTLLQNTNSLLGECNIPEELGLSEINRFFLGECNDGLSTFSIIGNTTEGMPIDLRIQRQVDGNPENNQFSGMIEVFDKEHIPFGSRTGFTIKSSLGNQFLKDISNID